MRLADALALPPAFQAAITGSGGKTSTLFHLAHSLPGITWITTTTHLGVKQAQLADQHFILDSPDELGSPLLLAEKVTLITGLMTIDYRLQSLDEAVLEAMHLITKQKGITLLIEADGARQLALKAPAAHEPSIPPWIEVVIVCAGLSAIGQPLSVEWVHRPELYSVLSGLKLGEAITPHAAARVLLHPQGGLKGIPPAARKIALLNQADSLDDQVSACSMAEGLLAGGYDGVFITSMRYHPEDGTWIPKS